jgi:hypothetical protein
MPPLAQSLTLLIKLSRQGRMIALRFLSLRTGWHALAILQKTWSPICPKKRLPSGNKPIKDLANAVAPDHDAGDAVTGWVVRRRPNPRSSKSSRLRSGRRFLVERSVIEMRKSRS